MTSKNEKANRQSQTSATRKKAGSQALKAQENYPNEKIDCEAIDSTGTQSAKETSPEANNGRGEEVVMDKAQDVVSQFLSKGEDRAAEYIDIHAYDKFIRKISATRRPRAGADCKTQDANIYAYATNRRPAHRVELHVAGMA